MCKKKCNYFKNVYINETIYLFKIDKSETLLYLNLSWEYSVRLIINNLAQSESIFIFVLYFAYVNKKGNKKKTVQVKIKEGEKEELKQKML